MEWLSLVVLLALAVALWLFSRSRCPLPPRFSWMDRAPAAIAPVSYQAKCGSCWAHSTAAALHGRLFVQLGIRAKVDTDDILNNTLGNKGCLGGTLVKAHRHARDVGVLTEGRRVKLVWFRDMYQSDVCDIKREIMTGGPVAMHILEHQSMKRMPPDTTWRPLPGERPVGGHAVMVFGWDDRKGGWLVQNSWGKGWANAGRGVVAYGAGKIDSLHILAGYFV